MNLFKSYVGTLAAIGQEKTRFKFPTGLIDDSATFLELKPNSSLAKKQTFFASIKKYIK